MLSTNQSSRVDSPQNKKLEATGVEVGLSGDDQIKIALQTILEGDDEKASMQEIYQAVEAHMGNHILSDHGKSSLRHFINRIAVEKGYIYPHDRENPGWRITPKGKRYLEEPWAPLKIEQKRTDNTTERETPPIPSTRDEEISDVSGVDEEEILGDELDDSVEPYDPSEINVVSKSLTIFQVMRKIKMREIELQPDFQRLVVWNQARKSRLVESILIGIPLPSFYLDATKPDKWLVVDGLQRLFTLHEFFNEKQLALNSLEFLQDLNGKKYDELPRKFQRDIEDAELNFYIIQPNTPAKVKFTIFYRVNTGGLVLRPQEIRHALFQGQATKLLQELANSTEFKQATTNSISPRRMDDRECVLRFIAFDLYGYRDYRKSDFNGFLSDAMDFINDWSSDELSSLKSRFLEAVSKAEIVFGEYAFRKMYETGGKRAPINKSLFEVWTVSLLKYQSEQLIKHRDEIVEAFVDLLNNDKEFEKAISQGTGSVGSVRKRFSTIENLLNRIVK